jgi:hypothetical protein
MLCARSTQQGFLVLLPRQPLVFRVSLSLHCFNRQAGLVDMAFRLTSPHLEPKSVGVPLP